MTISRFCLLVCFVFIQSSVGAQGFDLLFPGLNGSALIDSISANYRPNMVLDYTNARDTLYAKVLAKDDDSVRCIYSGHTLYLDPTQDPTQFIFQNGGTNGMNTEHSFPQGKGATVGTNAHSDMHHLFPTRIAVNDARADKPFAEVPDPQTQKWFRNNQVITNIPTQNIEDYAESGSQTFEPREAAKGDIARAILYFYTVYQAQADASDPSFFAIQRPTLCAWNLQDPADSSELIKTWRIAAYQDGKPNPFIVDCTLAARSWCPELGSCIVGTQAPALASLGLRIYPNPVVESAQLHMNLPFSGRLQGTIRSLLGQELAIIDEEMVPGGQFVLTINAPNITSKGTFLGFIELNLFGSNERVRQVIPVVFAR